MTCEFKKLNLKCVRWFILECDSTLSSESFTVADQECSLRLHVNKFLLFKFASLYFEVNEKLQTPVTVTLRVMSGSTVISSEILTLTDKGQEIWAHKGTSLLDSLLTFELVIHADFSDEKQAKELMPSEKVNKKSVELKKSDHLQSLSRDISKLLDESSTSDVDVTCENKTFKAHRIILGARSTVLSSMLRSNMLEKKTGLIKVEDIKASIFHLFLRYLYSGTLPELNSDMATQLYEISDKYDVEELKRACSEFLTKNLTEENACEVLVLADLHSDEDFRKDVISYIVDKNIPQKGRHWCNFCKSHCNLANEVMFLYIQKQCLKETS